MTRHCEKRHGEDYVFRRLPSCSLSESLESATVGIFDAQALHITSKSVEGGKPIWRDDNGDHRYLEACSLSRVGGAFERNPCLRHPHWNLLPTLEPSSKDARNTFRCSHGLLPSSSDRFLERGLHALLVFPPETISWSSLGGAMTYSTSAGWSSLGKQGSVVGLENAHDPTLDCARRIEPESRLGATCKGCGMLWKEAAPSIPICTLVA